MSWKRATTETRVRAVKDSLKKVEIRELTREMDLANSDIPLDVAYQVNGAHSYLDIANASDLLDSTESESERSHKRFLRYLHILQRVVHTTVLAETDVYKIDFQNSRLHTLIYKPYDDEAKRVVVAVAVADALLRLLAKADDLHGELEDAKIRVGIESGKALAVRNGTRGHRELLFLGNPANQAAKLLTGTNDGIYLGADARAALGSTYKATDPRAAVLTEAQIADCVKRSGLTLDVDAMLKRWKEELKEIALADFVFTRPTPPLSQLKVDSLSPKESRRIEAVALMADIDGFTKFVAERIGTKDAGEAVRILHVLRKELRDILNDFGGCKVRYIGDCLQGVVAEGAGATDAGKTAETALWCAAAMRDGLDVIHTEFPDSKDLGLAIGLDFGPLSLTRLGVKGSRDRCIAGLAMNGAQVLQEGCKGAETAVSDRAYDAAPAWIRKAFKKPFRSAGLNTAVLSAHETQAGGGSSGGASGGGGNGAGGKSAVVIPKAFGW